MARKTRARQADKAAADVQREGESAFDYTARRKTELSNDAEHSTYRTVVVEGLPVTVQERGPAR